MADGEATKTLIAELRPHLRNCPGCRGRLKAMQDSTEPLAAVLPVPLVVAAAYTGEHVSNLVLRAYEAVAGGLHERAIHGATKAQAAIEAASAGKVAAVAASAAAVAGGGYASVESSKPGAAEAHKPVVRLDSKARVRPSSEPTRSAAPRILRVRPPRQAATRIANEFGARATRSSKSTPEFSSPNALPSPSPTKDRLSSDSSTGAPEFGTTAQGVTEFGP